MGIDRKQNSRDDHTIDDCHSFGNSHPSSQSRKISIGVMVDVDDSVKTRPKTTKGDEAAVPTAEKVTFSKLNSTDNGNDEEAVKAAIMGKQTEATEHEISPWVSVRTFHQKKPTSEAIYSAMNLPEASGTCNELNQVKATPTAYSVQFFANQMLIQQSGEGKQNKFDRVSYRREGVKDGTKERVEEFTFATAQEILLAEKEVVEDKTNRAENRREALRMKLWEILGTLSSPIKQDSQVRNLGVNSLNPEQNIVNKSKPVVKPRQNSDTIESDSESPEHIIKRPVTRSLTRKRATRTMQTNKIRKAPSSTGLRKNPDKQIFPFDQSFFGRLDGAVTGIPFKSYGKKKERESVRNKAHRIRFSAKDSTDENQHEKDTRKITKWDEKTSMHGNGKGSFHIWPPENNGVELENETQEKDPSRFPVMKLTDQPGNINHSTFPQHKGQQEDLTNSFLKNVLDPHFDIQSPTFEIRKPTKNLSPDSAPKTNHGELDDHSPASFNSLLASKPDYHKTNMGTESSDDAEELEGSPLMKSEPIMEERDAENGLSNSSSEERDSKSSREGSPIDEGTCVGRGTESLSPEIGIVGKPKVVLCPSKRLRSQEDINFNGFSPILASPKGTQESNGIQGPSDHNQEEGLTNDIALFALAFERVKSKIKLVTDKKSSGVLMSVAEGIHLQLQNAESQIQRDVGKLTNLGKTKRKRLETEFKEQQEQLKIIYQKFKEEVNQHLQKSRSTLEGLEAQEREFRGIVEKHKTSQTKLLKEVEEAIETQINDAQRRITAVHKLAREKMLQLKYVLAECLKEGVLN